MKNEPTTKKGFFAFLREACGKTGGCCCGPGESCGSPNKQSEPTKNKEAPATKAAAKPNPK